MHRFSCGWCSLIFPDCCLLRMYDQIVLIYFLFCLRAVSEILDELVSTVPYRIGMDNGKPNIKLLVRGEFLSWDLEP
jgi:hypothetical protein